MDSQSLQQVSKADDDVDMETDEASIQDPMDIAIEQSKQMHELASLLIKNKQFRGFFVPFMQSLKLSASDEFRLEEQCGATTRPIYPVLSNALSTWKGNKGNGATFAVLIQVLKNVEMGEARAIVEEYYKSLGIDETSEPVAVDRDNIVKLTSKLQDDEGINTDFLKFLDALGLPFSSKFPIKNQFEKVYTNGAFYELVSKALEAWKSKHGRAVATYKGLVEALETSGLKDSADLVRTYFKENVEDDGNSNR